MTKRVTTSAQKTVRMAKDLSLRRLQATIGDQESVSFEATANPDILVAQLEDGSKLYVASFDKDDGRSIAMIDHKDVDEASRERWHQHWRQSIDEIFG